MPRTGASPVPDALRRWGPDLGGAQDLLWGACGGQGAGTAMPCPRLRGDALRGTCSVHSLWGHARHGPPSRASSLCSNKTPLLRRPRLHSTFLTREPWVSLTDGQLTLPTVTFPPSSWLQQGLPGSCGRSLPPPAEVAVPEGGAERGPQGCSAREPCRQRPREAAAELGPKWAQTKVATISAHHLNSHLTT